MVNHGMDVNVINATLEAIRRLHEQPREDKVGLFSDDSSQKVRLYTVNGSVHESRPGPWRDSLACACLDDTLDSEEIPQICSLHVSVRTGHPETVRILLEGGANVNKPDAKGRTTITLAEYQGNKCIYDLLLSYQNTRSKNDTRNGDSILNYG